MRKRSKYRPKPVIVNPIEFVIAGNKPLPEDKRRIAAIQYHDSLSAMTHGKGTYKDWRVVCDMLNESVAMSQAFFGGDYIEELKEAMLAHASCGKRFQEKGALGYTGPELQAVNYAAELIEEQLKLVTVREIRLTKKIVDEAHEQKNYFASVVQGRGLNV